MSRFPARRAVRCVSFRSGDITGQIAGNESSVDWTAFGDAAETLMLKAALKKAVAKTDAPAYLIDAIRREIRK